VSRKISGPHISEPEKTSASHTTLECNIAKPAQQLQICGSIATFAVKPFIHPCERHLPVGDEVASSGNQLGWPNPLRQKLSTITQPAMFARIIQDSGAVQTALPALLIILAVIGCQSTHYPNSLATHDSSAWENDIASFEKSDRIAPPPQGPIVFTGSSSIRLWKTLELDFPEHYVLNRGFGGCQLADVAHYADRIITPYRPSQVVIYAGGNDINAGKTPEIVFGDFVGLVRKIKSHRPNARISYISIAPNPARWAQVDKVKKTNALIADYCRRHRIDFIDVFPRMLGPDGQPRPELFVSDRLHMNATGYALWREAVRPCLPAP